MRVVVACGGTGGHVIPGLATAEALKARGHSVALWLAGRNVEGESILGWEGRVYRLAVTGLRPGLTGRLCGLAQQAQAVFKAWGELRRFKADAVLAMGSYASVAPGIAAKLHGVPLVLHEANTVPGRALSLLAPLASRLALGFDQTERFAGLAKSVVTGLPLRTNLVSAATGGIAPRDTRSVPGCILVTGGSQGARIFNETLPEVMVEWQRAGIAMPKVVHLSGHHDYEAVCKRYEAAGVGATVMAFTSDMPALYRDADLVVSRAGASTCHEIALFGVPAILVPLPSSIRNHQLRNAQVMAAQGGMIVMEQRDMTSAALYGLMRSLWDDQNRLQKMRDALLNAVPSDGAARLACLVEAVGK